MEKTARTTPTLYVRFNFLETDKSSETAKFQFISFHNETLKLPRTEMDSDSETSDYELIGVEKDDDIKPGTQIAVKRTSSTKKNIPFSYYHHGVYTGDNEIVHLSGDSKTDAKPRKCNKDEFLDGEQKLYEVKYNDSVKVFTEEETIQKATEAVEKSADWPPYNPISNNCESFARYLTTGEPKSVQAENVLAEVSDVASLIAVSSAVASKSGGISNRR